MKRLSVLLSVLLVSLLVTNNCFAASRLVYPVFKAWTTTGKPLSGGLLYTYDPGTTNARATYTTEDGSVELSNPVVLDSLGEETIFLSGPTKLVLRTPTGSVLWTEESVYGIAPENQSIISLDESYFCDLKAAVDDLTSTEVLLQVDCQAALADGETVTIPSTLTIERVGAGRISGPSVGSASIVVNGGMTGDYWSQWFDITNLSVSGGAKLPYTTAEMFGAIGDGITDDNDALEAALSFANGGKVLLSTGKTYYMTGLEISKPLNLDMNAATFESYSSTHLLVSSAIDYLKVKDGSFSYSVDPATSTKHSVDNWPTEVAGEESDIGYVDIKNCKFGYSKVRLASSVMDISLRDNTWEHEASTKVSGPYLNIGTGTDDFDNYTEGGRVEGNIWRVYPTDGDNQDIVKITGSRSGVVVHGNTIENLNMAALAQLDCYTGLNGIRISNNRLVNTQVHRKQTGDATISAGYSNINNNSFMFASGYTKAQTAIYHRGSLYNINNNDINFRASSTAYGIHLDNEDDNVTPLNTQNSHLGIISGNLINLSSASATSIAIFGEVDASVKGGGVSIFGNIIYGGNRVASIIRSATAAVGNIFFDTTDNSGATAFNLSDPSVMVGNIATTEGTPVIGDGHQFLNPGFLGVIDTVAAGSDIDADRANNFLVSGTGIVGITNGVRNQEITITGASGAVTIEQSATVRLAGGIDLVLGPNDVLRLKKVSTVLWVQTAASDNS